MHVEITGVERSPEELRDQGLEGLSTNMLKSPEVAAAVVRSHGEPFSKNGEYGPGGMGKMSETTAGVNGCTSKTGVLVEEAEKPRSCNEALEDTEVPLGPLVQISIEDKNCHPSESADGEAVSSVGRQVADRVRK